MPVEVIPATSSAAPPRLSSLSALGTAERLPFSECIVRIPKSAIFVSNPALIGKLRGALGTALMEAASPEVSNGKDCPWVPPCAYQILWRQNCEVRPGYALPSPYVIEADAVGADLRITLRLFGAASDYLGEACDALIRGLRNGLSGIGRLDLSGRDMALHQGVEVPPIRGMAELTFVTPVLIRNTEAGNHVDPRALLKGLVKRVDALARWGGMSLSPEAEAELLDAIDAVEGTWEQADVVPWRRGAIRQGKVLPMGGAVGRVVYRGELTPLAPLLALGEICFAGGRTAFGQGRFRLERYW